MLFIARKVAVFLAKFVNKFREKNYLFRLMSDYSKLT
jgi:hypothetical protein